MNRLLRGLAGDEEIATLFTDEADLAAMLRTEAALAEAEAAEELIGRDAAERIAAVCRDLAAQAADGALPLEDLAAGIAKDGVAVPALVRQLKRVVGPPHDTAVHHGATSQDIIDTSLVLRLQQALTVLDERIARVLAAFSALPGDVPLMAHTRMQQALPILSVDKIATWAAPLARHRLRLAELKPRLLLLQLAGPVGDRAGFEGKGDAVAARMAVTLGLACAAPWHSARDGIAECGAWLALVTGSLGKFGQDVALMAQNEVGAVALPHGGGSSAMAHKSNPVGAEILVALARFAAGLSGTLHQALVHENERSGAAWTLEWLILPQLAEAAGAALRIASGLANGMMLKPFSGSAAAGR